LHASAVVQYDGECTITIDKEKDTGNKEVLSLLYYTGTVHHHDMSRNCIYNSIFCRRSRE